MVQEDLSNELELADNEIDEQPQEPVAGDEDGEQPQSPGEPEEFDVDLGGDDQESQTANVAPVYKLKKLRAQKRELKSENAQVRNENEELKAQLNELRSEVFRISAGKEPNYLDYDSDEKFREDYAKWFAATQDARRQQPQATQSRPQAQAPIVDDSVIDDHYTRAAKLEAEYNIKDYEDAERSLRDRLGDEFGDNGSLIADMMIKETGAKSHLVIYAMKSEAKKSEFIHAIHNDAKNGTRTAERLLWKWTDQAEIKPRKSNVKTEPIDAPVAKGGTGGIEAQIKKALETYQKNPTLDNHAKLRSLRSQHKG